MYVVAALQKVSPGLGIRAVELLAMGADPVQVVLPTLLNDLDTIPSPVVLILDDYHLVVGRAMHEQLAFFISRMPANLHLVLATRADPTLPLARLRASGELAEVRTDDLRFGPTEADHLLNDVLGLGLAPTDIQLLHRRTEGWAAGLYLAALSLAGRADTATFIKTFAGDNRHIVDYLMAEVLDGQPPNLRSFLLRTSVLGRLSGALCDAVLQTSGSAAVLQKIERETCSWCHWTRRVTGIAITSCSVSCCAPSCAAPSLISSPICTGEPRRGSRPRDSSMRRCATCSPPATPRAALT